MKKKCSKCIYGNKQLKNCAVTNEEHYEFEEENNCMSFSGKNTLKDLLEERTILEESLYDLLSKEEQLTRLNELSLENQSLRMRIQGLIPQIRVELIDKGVFK